MRHRNLRAEKTVDAFSARAVRLPVRSVIGKEQRLAVKLLLCLRIVQESHQLEKMLRRLLRARQKVAGVGQKPPRPLQDREIVVRDLARLELSKIPELRQYVDRLPHLKPQRVNLARHQK